MESIDNMELDCLGDLLKDKKIILKNTIKYW